MREYTGTGTDFYLATPEVAELVNLAIALDRPLLVEGEPGCGKTTLAKSIAVELGIHGPIKISVKSTSSARDLLYRFDSLRRLQDAQDPKNPNTRFVYPYLSLGLFGEAIQSRSRSVVLIDEIDKADIDFPNDLLEVLDGYSFQIDDLPTNEEGRCLKENKFGRTVSSGKGKQPIVVITSNREKQLPEPFLRRCLFVQLRFPSDNEELEKIVLKNTKLLPEQINKKVVRAAIKAFRKIRDKSMSADAQKPPTTSELIDWVRILHWKLPPKGEKRLDSPLPPYWQTLFKTVRDQNTYEAISKKATGE